MSFAADVKDELCRIHHTKKCCTQAECYGILLACNTFSSSEIKIVTEHAALARRLPPLFQKAFKITFDRLSAGGAKQILSITNPKKIDTIRQHYGIDSGALALHVNYAVLEESCCQTAFLRGVFLAGGSVSDPRKGYHLELSTSHLSVSREMHALMLEMGLEPKLAKRKGNAILYFKHSDRIEDFLTCIGAPLCAMEVMNAKLEKDLRGSVNRRVNCDSANADKSVEAAMTQIDAIRRLQGQGRFALLPEKLRETAQLRLDYPEDTLSQLAEQSQTPITKSALNHRLRKLVQLSGEASHKA